MKSLAAFLVLALATLASATTGDNSTLLDRGACQKGGCCPRIGTYCNCVGTFKDAACCPGCCTFNCHQGKWRCTDSCGGEVVPSCKLWGWEGLGQCPLNGAPCSCIGHYIDTTCCHKAGHCRFVCSGGKWKREEPCRPLCKDLPGVGTGGLCPAAGSPCNCRDKFRDVKCCSKTGYCTFECVNGKWARKEKCGLPSCSSVARCGYQGGSCNCVGSTGGSTCCRTLAAAPRQIDAQQEDISKFLLGGCRYATCLNGRWRCSSTCQGTGDQLLEEWQKL